MNSAGRMRGNPKQFIAFLLFFVGTFFAVTLMRRGFFNIACWLASNAQRSGIYKADVRQCKSVSAWVENNGSCREVFSQRTVTLNAVREVGYNCLNGNAVFNQKHEVSLPRVSFDRLQNVEVIGGSEMIFTQDGMVLYDEIALGDIHRYGSKVISIVPHNRLSPYLPAASGNFLLCLYYQSARSIKITSAISLLKDHSSNYYHWLLECLPRAIISLRQLGCQDAVLLVDANLPTQFHESLYLLAETIHLVPVPHGMRLQVADLQFTSIFSPTHDYYGKSPRADDFLIAPEAVALLRESFLPTMPGKFNISRYIYVARSGGTHRSITNEAEMMEMLVKMGFTIVYPGKLNFVEQVSLFAQASIIVGPTGAGMANIVFAHPNCKIAVLAAATRNANYFLFAQLAQYVGQEIVYVGGKPRNAHDLHSDYKADVLAMERLVGEWKLAEALKG